MLRVATGDYHWSTFQSNTPLVMILVLSRRLEAWKFLPIMTLVAHLNSFDPGRQFTLWCVNQDPVGQFAFPHPTIISFACIPQRGHKSPVNKGSCYNSKSPPFHRLRPSFAPIVVGSSNYLQDKRGFQEKAYRHPGKKKPPNPCSYYTGRSPFQNTVFLSWGWVAPTHPSF